MHTGVTVQLVMQVKAQLQGMHTQSVWSTQEPESSMSLPSFNAYPQLSVTAAGEYLMMLPQLLESLLTDSEEGTDAEWLDKVTCMCLRVTVCALLCYAGPCCAVLRCWSNSTMQCCFALCCAVLCCLCCAALCCLCCAVLRCAALCCAVLCCAALCCAVLRCAASAHALLMSCHLEHSATSEASTPVVSLSDVWIERVQVASGAAELYAEEVQQIHSLTPHGTHQLLADLEYFCNVLAALGVALPPTLTTWQVLTPPACRI